MSVVWLGFFSLFLPVLSVSLYLVFFVTPSVFFLFCFARPPPPSPHPSVGGAGICSGPANFMGNPYMAIPIAITVEGANTLTRSLIIFGQGLTRSHPHLLDIIRSIQHGDDMKVRGSLRIVLLCSFVAVKIDQKRIRCLLVYLFHLWPFFFLV